MTESDRKTPIDALFDAAGSVRERAHAPYSRFRVGAAVIDETGALHTGCNVENAAYPEGICAEAAAIAAMVASGGRRIRAIAVIGSGAAMTTPCGGCRQRIREFADADTRIHLHDPATDSRHSLSLEELLPLAFGPANLKDEIR
ncbi:MAG: cytidine deaminase Cdd [Saliniramus fredricksonii]|uniref:Cytidine deaminase n=1 Tax=Saliniramus fredricksonii TaxID=1653334 RepID=A0A0P7ZY39_9HYPH|nr:cytidine deaminase [Saliniramus fredricksonii]KPQ09823.1 MAG: cytidine deaminase Cdd [Saliniramus fredricksonii]SCC82140.1 cytidine deaminase [Saliniramus fredricksonii]